jgi:hypothetical protein
MSSFFILLSIFCSAFLVVLLYGNSVKSKQLKLMKQIVTEKITSMARNDLYKTYFGIFGKNCFKCNKIANTKLIFHDDGPLKIMYLCFDHYY